MFAGLVPQLDATQLADSVLENLVIQRSDYKFTTDWLLQAYRDTFSHDTMRPVSHKDECIREFIEQLMWEGERHHCANHNGCESSGESFNDFIEGHRVSAFNYVRQQWHQMNSENRMSENYSAMETPDDTQE